MTDKRPSDDPVMTLRSRLSHAMHVIGESTTLLKVVSASPLLPLMIWRSNTERCDGERHQLHVHGGQLQQQPYP